MCDTPELIRWVYCTIFLFRWKIVRRSRNNIFTVFLSFLITFLFVLLGCHGIFMIVLLIGMICDRYDLRLYWKYPTISRHCKTIYYHFSQLILELLLRTYRCFENFAQVFITEKWYFTFSNWVLLECMIDQWVIYKDMLTNISQFFSAENFDFYIKIVNIIRSVRIMVG